MEGDNVIYVQVDETGRVINYTSNNAIGDKLILLQDDGQEGHVAISSAAQSTTPTPNIEQLSTIPRSSATPQTVNKPAVINLASIPSGMTLVEGGQTGVQLQQKAATVLPTPSQTIISSIQKPTPTPTRVNVNQERIILSPQSISSAAPVQRISLKSPTGAPQKITINPHRVATIGQQKIAINPVSKMGNISFINDGTGRSATSGQVRIISQNKPAVVGTKSIITPTGVKQVSLVGSPQRTPTKITIKAPNSSPERISLDQLMKSGGVTVQRISDASLAQGVSGPQVITVNSTTGIHALAASSQPSVMQVLNEDHSQPTVHADDILNPPSDNEAYAKPDTTTTETDLLAYQVMSEGLSSSGEGISMETDVLAAATQAAGLTDDIVNAMITDKPSTSAENTNDIMQASDNHTATHEDQHKERDMLSPSSARAHTDGSENEAMDPSEEEEEDMFDELPAGLIRGEPIMVPEEQMEEEENEEEKEGMEQKQVEPKSSTTITEAVDDGRSEKVDTTYMEITQDDKLDENRIKEHKTEVVKVALKEREKDEMVAEKSQKQEKQMIEISDKGIDDIMPLEMPHNSPRKVRLPLAVQSETSDTEGTDSENETALKKKLSAQQVPQNAPEELNSGITEEEVPQNVSQSPLTGPQTSATELQIPPIEPQNSVTDQSEETPSTKDGALKKGKMLKTDPPEESEKKHFMKKNFNLFDPREIEEQKNKRRSARISNAEQIQQADAEIEKDEKKQPTTEKEEKKKPTQEIRKESSQSKPQEQSDTRPNIFDMFGTSKSSGSSGNDAQKYINKLEAVNTELKVRIRELEIRNAKSPQTKYKEKTQIRALQSKLDRFEKLNEELAHRLSEYEGTDENQSTTPEKKVDMTVLKHGKLSFSTPGSTKREAPRLETPVASSGQRHTASSLEKREKKIKALHDELDHRTSLLRARESKLQRMMAEVKDRENKVVYREQALTRRVQDIEYRERILEGKTKAAIEKRNKQGGGAADNDGEEDLRSKELVRFEFEQRERELKRRENEMREREQEAQRKEELLKVTEKELHELHIEIKQEYEKNSDTPMQMSSDLLDTPRTAYLNLVGATPKSGRSSRLSRKVAETANKMTPSPSNFAQKGERIIGQIKPLDTTNTEENRRKSKSEIREETPVRATRRDSDAPHTTSQSVAKPDEQTTPIPGRGRGRPRKTPKEPEPAESEMHERDEKDAPVEESVTAKPEVITPARGRGRPRKSTAETPQSQENTPKAAVKANDEYEFDDEVESSQSESETSDKQTRFISRRSSLSETKTKDLKQGLKQPKKPRGSIRSGLKPMKVLRKRSRSHSASPAPSESKKQKT